jgi:putative acetyltransferase
LLDGLDIRAATAADADAIGGVVRAAFAGTGFGHQGEADLVRMLEADGDMLVSLVAEIAGVVVGHVLFSRMDVEADGAALPAAGLAPVAVLPNRQGQGIGGALIRAGLDALRVRGIAMSFVLGDAAYYPRFGYLPELAARFASPFAGPHLMAQMLDPEANWPRGGRADYAPAFGPPPLAGSADKG